MYVLPYGTISIYDPAAVGSTWVKISSLDSFDATEDTNLIECWDNRDLLEKKTGRTSSTLAVTQYNKGTLNSIYTLKNDDLWFAECIKDDRNPIDADGLPVYYEIRLMRGKISSIKEEKGGAEDQYKITGEGSYTVSTKRVLQRGVTPTACAISGSDNTATSGVPENYVITATDFAGDSIDITDLTATALMGEITSVTVELVSGDSTISVAAGADDATKAVTFTGAGSTTVRAKIVSAHGGITYGTNKVVTVSS